MTNVGTHPGDTQRARVIAAAASSTEQLPAVAPRWLKELHRLCGALAVLAIAAYLVVALLRLRNVGELEWMEGGMVREVQRVLGGSNLYGPPTLEATPYIYTPLFTWIGAAVSWVVGVGLEPLRAISIVSSLLAFWAAGRVVVAETGDRWAGLVTAGLLAAAYVVGGAWYDVGRVDSLMLALVLLGLLSARTATSTRAAVVAGTVMVLAVMTKQDALLPAIACFPWLLRRDRRLGLAYAGTLTVGLGVAVAVLQVTSGGWFLYYVVQVPAAHPWIPGSYLGFFTSDLRPFAWSGALAVLALVGAHRRIGSTGVQWWFVGPVLASLVATGWFGRVHSGGWNNVLIPALAGIAMLTGIALAVVRARGAPMLTGLCVVLVVTQFIGLRWWPPDQVPGAASSRRTRAAVEVIRDLPGPVYLPGHPWLLALAGRPGNAQSAAMADVLRGPQGAGPDGLRSELESAVHSQRFASVVVDTRRRLSYLPADFTQFYRFERLLVPGRDRIEPITGIPTGPSEVWVPR